MMRARALSMLIKPASGHCNLRCAYCFYSDVTEKRMEKNKDFMSYDLLETLVEKAFSETREFVSFGFQGGEPTLVGLDFFRRLIELEAKYNSNKIKTAHTLQTNGLTLNGEWADFLRENNFLVGLSVDSAKEIHDNLRRDPKGEGTHSRSMEAAKLLEKHKTEFNILSVVTRNLASKPDKAYNFYKRHNFRYIQFIPCLDGLGEEHGAHRHSLDADVYGHFLCRVFDLWYDDFIKGEYYSIRAFDNYVQMLMGKPPENCAMSGVCNAYALVEADGSVYPCDFYAADDYYLGNIQTNSFNEMLRGQKAKNFIDPSTQVDELCRTCEYFYICRGGCRRDREPIKNGKLQLNHYCEAYKKFFKHALPRMKAVASSIK
jgi:uncharacterized protein